MSILHKFGFLGKRGGAGAGETSRDKLLENFRRKYANFQTLLESNTELLKIISDIEQKISGQSVFGVSYIEAQTMRCIFHSARMVYCFENMSRRAHPRLKKALEDIHQKIKMESGETGTNPTHGTDFTLSYDTIGRQTIELVGGKNAHIGEIHKYLGILTPRGFAITTAAFRHYITANDLTRTIMRMKSKADIIEAETILQVSEEIQRRIMEVPVPRDLAQEIIEAHGRLADATGTGRESLNISMRSSAIGEDSALSFAGQYLTVLNVPPDRILHEYKRIIASLFSPHAISYRLHMAITFQEAVMAVACQEMIQSRASGVMYTRNPVDLLENRILIKAVRGLGPYAVDGIVPPDTYIFDKQNPPNLVESKTAEKHKQLIATAAGGLMDQEVPPNERRVSCLNAEQAKLLAYYGLLLEKHFGMPQDVEWALDEQSRIVILQSRPLRVDVLETGGHKLPNKPIAGYPILLEGGEIGCAGIGYGPVVHVTTESDLASFPDGAVLVSTNSSPQFVMAMPKAKAILSDSGSIAGHMASLCREYMVPTLLNLKNATQLLSPGTLVTVDALNARVYLGRVCELADAGLQVSSGPHQNPSWHALRRRADLIVPLNLKDPKSAEFAPEYCRTIHDIMRYIHEKSYEEIFQLGDLVTDRGKLSCKLKASLPLDLYVIDLGNGLSVDATRVTEITRDKLLSAPLAALLDGMTHKDLRSHEPRPIHIGGFFSVMSRQLLTPPNMAAERFGDRSYAIISDRYLNFSSRVGYHYSVLDSYCGQTPAKNYIHFQFKGGAADDLRRNRRALMIENVLVTLGFLVDTVADCVTARLSKLPAPQIQEKLDMLGRLLIFTRQMDMLMHNDDQVEKMAECFLKGNYSLDT